MANLGNAWHLPATGEPRGQGGMRDPVGPVVPGTAITLTFGNQYQGEGNAANQLQGGSALLHRRQGDAGWTVAPVRFQQAAGNNKYFAATLPAGSFAVGDVVIYYFRIAYDDRDTTFVHAAGAASAVTAEEATAQAAAFRFPVESSAVRGAWSEVFALPNVAIHSHLLHTGQVLFWGRRDRPDQSLDVHSCTPLLWDPASGVTTAVARPTLADGTTINLFCSGHTFLADGRLLVTGGHLFDSQGLNQATVYDPIANTWTPQAVMEHGRWYPTATTLPDGRVLVTSGSYLDHGKTPNNPIPQIWDDGVWTSAAGLPAGQTFELYPRTHAVADDTI